MISRLTPFIHFSGGSNDKKTGNTKERQTTITKQATPPSSGSLHPPTKDSFDSNQGKRSPKFVEQEHRDQYENPDERILEENFPPTNTPPLESGGHTPN